MKHYESLRVKKKSHTAEFNSYFLVFTVAIKKRSRVPGVMITQYVEVLPAGMSTPDFAWKPMPMTTQEGKKGFFKAMVSGEPAPAVTWGRNKGEVDDPEKYQTRFDERAQEHILEIPNVKPDQADTYKCFVTNEYGQAVCSATLNVIEVGLKKNAQKANIQAPQDFRKMLKKTVVVTRKKQLPPRKEGEIDPKFLELLLSAPKKDYEKICFDFGVTDFRWLLKRLNKLKKERQDEQAKVVEQLDNVKQIEVKPNGRAEFSLDMTLHDPNSAINLYKDGTMVLYGNDENSKHSLQKTGTNYVFSIKDPQPEDAGFYQLDVEDANVLTTDFQVPAVEFIAKIKDVKAFESEDAIFQCVLSTPLNRITWSKQDSSLEHGDKYEITVSEDKLIHTLRVKDCKMEDYGVFYAIAGITSSCASLKVEDRGAQFVCGLSDTLANIGERAELSCKLSSETSEGRWYKNGKLLNNEDGVTIIKDGACHRLVIDCCKKDDAAVYSFEAEGRKSEATLNIQDSPKIDDDALGKFTKPMITQCYKDDDELLPALNVKIETSATESLLKCQRKDGGEVKIKNEFGTMEAISKLIVLDKPTPPQGPVDIMESAVTSVEFKWKPPKHTGGCPVTNYIIERQQVGLNKWLDLGEIPGSNPSYKDLDVDPGRRYCYRIRAKNAQGISDYLQTEDIAARVLPTVFLLYLLIDEPKTPGPVALEQTVHGKVLVSWAPSPDQELDDRLYYMVSQWDSNTRVWKNVAGRLFTNSHTVNNILPGVEYHFRIYAKNDMGLSDPSQSPTWGANSNRVPIPSNGGNSSGVSFERPPSILVPLKVHAPPKGYQLYMTCAVRGCPTPTVSWYLNDVCINFDKNYYITNSFGVCSMYILRVRSKDSGVCKVVAVNSFGKAECSTKLSVRD
ncbi:immunoglobulin-like and fibronectin type III domain-containing protein 1 [Anoplopoma fimbria]|uniref:immunoglobulin-like and fibronectin type III domain-containing protein 1 n=1 Tax=Anoplopoma fimbria TaxID=229290 RepID=UPI0023ED0C94|nr:immunoglobulin-like and fibronectin type III domain-containing protein 1 [Anoplopoma fimbria]